MLDIIDAEADEADEVDEAYEAVAKERMSIFDTLLSNPDINVNIQDIKGATALHCLQYRFEECDILISKLIERGADLSPRNSEKQTPLHLASRAKDYTSVEVLLSHGADISHTDRNGLNSLHWAAYSTDAETMSRILEAANTNCLKVAASVDKGGRNALHHLLGNCPDIEAVRLLVRNGVDLNGRDSDGNTPLAAYLNSSWAVNDQICMLLLSEGSDTTAVNDHGLALAHLFSKCLPPNITVLEALMEFGVNLAATDREGRTVLHHSAINGSITETILSFLLDKTTLRCEDPDNLGNTPLQYAAEEAGKERHGLVRDREGWLRSLEILKGLDKST